MTKQTVPTTRAPILFCAYAGKCIPRSCTSADACTKPAHARKCQPLHLLCHIPADLFLRTHGTVSAASPLTKYGSTTVFSRCDFCVPLPCIFLLYCPLKIVRDCQHHPGRPFAIVSILSSRLFRNMCPLSRINCILRSPSPSCLFCRCVSTASLCHRVHFVFASL